MGRTAWSIAAAMGTALTTMVVPPNAEAATVTIGDNQEILVDGEPFLPIMQWLQSSSRIEYQKVVDLYPDSGQVAIGGRASSEWDLVELRQAVG